MTDAEILAALRAAVAPPKKRRPRKKKRPCYKLDTTKKAWPSKIPPAMPADARAWLDVALAAFPGARFRVTLAQKELAPTTVAL